MRPLTVGSGSTWAEALRAGDAFGRFELIREVGRGRCGVVWEARDRNLGRSVGFKAVLLRAGAAGSACQERLLRHAETAARLSHPNIVATHDIGRAGSGLYLVLELLRGESLDRRLDRGAVPLPQALHIGIEVAKALSHAHAHGVMHGGLTPRNVFLCEDGQVKLLGLGMAHALGRWKGEGCAPYRAPEQWLGAPEDERIDVFALGALLFRMLTGEHPFGADARGIRGPRAAPELEVSAPTHLGSVVTRMLEKNPLRRQRNGGEVLAALTAVQDELERSSGAPAQVRTRQRLPSRLAFTAALAVCGIVGVAGAWRAARAGDASSQPETTRPVTLAVLPLANLSGDATQDYFSDGMTEEIAGKLARLRGLAVTAHTTTSRYKGSQRSAKLIGAEIGVAYLLEGSVRRSADRVRVSATLVRTADERRIWTEDFDARFDDIFKVQERLATRLVEALDMRLGPGDARSLQSWGTHSAAAWDEYLQGQVLVGQELPPEELEAARGHFERAAQLDPLFAPALAGLATTEALVYRGLDDSPERLARAKAFLERSLAADPTLVQALLASGDLRAVTFDYAGAAERYRQVVALDPSSYLAWDNLCWVLGYVPRSQAAGAEPACRRAIEIKPGYTWAHYHLARVLTQGGRLEEAAQELSLLEERAPGSFLIDAGKFWLAMGAQRPGDALAALDRTARLKDTNLALAWRAMALAQLGDLERAFAVLDDALAHGYRDFASLRTEPSLAPLRPDPRFSRLLAKHGILSPVVSTDSRSP